MKKEELIKKIKRIGAHDFEINLYSKFFKKEVSTSIFSADSSNDEIIISDHLMSRINDFLEYDDFEIETIQAAVFDDYKNAISCTSYGMITDEILEKNNYDNTKANQEYFNINTEKEAFEALVFDSAYIVEYRTSGKQKSDPRYFGLLFKTPWDIEHQLQIGIENGKFKKLY